MNEIMANGDANNEIEQQPKTIPNKAFDMEYQTMWKREMQYLKDHDIKCTFIKNTKDYNIPVYKYKKTPELFYCVAHFYESIEEERKSKKEAAAHE